MNCLLAPSHLRLVALPMLILTGAAGFAGEPAIDKSGYSLANPTPETALRELSTDRPDQTESPHTVDAGRFQIELDFVNYTTDHDTAAGSDLRTRVLNLAPVNLKVGLLHNMDFQLMIDPYVEVRVEDRVAGTKTRDSGFGDITTRLKMNFWGNDGGRTAFAMMPFVKWPLSASAVRNGETEGGVIFPFSLELPAGWGMGAMTEVDFVSDGTGGYETEYVNSITFARDLTERLGGYVEFFTVLSRAPGFKWQGQFDVGFTYALRDDTQLDFGCNFGVTKSAPDFQPFIGYSRRF
jgi:hypothetical protein